MVLALRGWRRALTGCELALGGLFKAVIILSSRRVSGQTRAQPRLLVKETYGLSAAADPLCRIVARRWLYRMVRIASRRPSIPLRRPARSRPSRPRGKLISAPASHAAQSCAAPAQSRSESLSLPPGARKFCPRVSGCRHRRERFSFRCVHHARAPVSSRACRTSPHAAARYAAPGQSTAPSSRHRVQPPHEIALRLPALEFRRQRPEARQKLAQLIARVLR